MPACGCENTRSSWLKQSPECMVVQFRSQRFPMISRLMICRSRTRALPTLPEHKRKCSPGLRSRSVVAHGSGSRVGRGRPSPPGEDGHHHEGSDRQDDDPHAVREGQPRSHHRCRSPRARAREPGTRSGREHQRLRRCTHPACLGSSAASAFPGLLHSAPKACVTSSGEGGLGRSHRRAKASARSGQISR